MESAVVESGASSRSVADPRAARTIAELFLSRVAATPAATAFLEPRGEEWGPVSWQQLGDRVRAAAGGLRALGLRPGDRCAEKDP